MTSSGDRLDRIEQILERVAIMQQDMAARQQDHDAALERHDTEIEKIADAIALDAENIRALARIAELHNLRLEHLKGRRALLGEASPLTDSEKRPVFFGEFRRAHVAAAEDVFGETFGQLQAILG